MISKLQAKWPYQGAIIQLSENFPQKRSDRCLFGPILHNNEGCATFVRISEVVSSLLTLAFFWSFVEFYLSIT